MSLFSRAALLVGLTVLGLQGAVTGKAVRPTLVVFSSDRMGALGRFGPAFRATDLVEYGIQFKRTQPQAAGGKESWELRHPDGRILGSGTGVPKPSDLLSLLQAARIRPPHQLLQAFLAEHPDHLEARVELAQMLWERAEAQTARLFSVPRTPDLSVGAAWGSLPVRMPVPKDVASLSAKVDQALWGPVAQALEAYFASPHWMELLPELRSETLYPAASHSPIMRDLCRRHVGRFRDLHAIQTAWFPHWETWSLMQRVSGMRAAEAFGEAPLLNGSIRLFLRPPARMGLEPTFVGTLVDDAKAHSDWTYAIRVLWDAFEVARDRDLPCPSEERGKLDPDAFLAPVPPLWEEAYRVLAEALLLQGDIARAEAVVQWVARQERLRSHLPTFLNLGRQHAGEAVAERWRRYAESPCGVEEGAIARDLRKVFWIRPLTLLLWGPEAEGLQRVRTAVQSQAALDGYWLNGMIFEAVSQSAQGIEVGRRFGWKEGQRWGVVDRLGRLSAEGTGIPTLQVLQETFEKHSLIQQGAYLKAWLKGHPDDLIAWRECLITLGGVAERRTRRALGMVTPTPPGSGGFLLADGTYLKAEGTASSLPSARPRDLTDAEDESIWSPYCEALRTFFEERELALVELGRFSSRRTAAEMGGVLIPELTAFSPRCRSLFSDLLPRVESALERAPSRGRLWSYWRALARSTQAPLLPLLKRLTPQPLDEATWPPPGLRKEVVQAYLSDRAYEDVLAVCRPGLEELYGLPEEMGSFALSQGNLLNQPQWEELGSPSFEALVASGRTDEALEVLKRWLRQGGWKGAVGSCIGIAGRLKGDALVANLKAMEAR